MHLQEAQTHFVSGLGRKLWNLLHQDLADVVSLAYELYIFCPKVSRYMQ